MSALEAEAADRAGLRSQLVALRTEADGMQRGHDAILADQQQSHSQALQAIQVMLTVIAMLDNCE